MPLRFCDGALRPLGYLSLAIVAVVLLIPGHSTPNRHFLSLRVARLLPKLSVEAHYKDLQPRPRLRSGTPGASTPHFFEAVVRPIAVRPDSTASRPSNRFLLTAFSVFCVIGSLLLRTAPPRSSERAAPSWCLCAAAGSGADPHRDTIAAIATAVAAGVGSVAIVRVSGPTAAAIGQRLFRIAGTKQQWESHRVLYGHIVGHATGGKIDEALLVYMKAPRTFTAEDVVEFHCHGGRVIVQEVLSEVLACGARLALPGEFSQRAFLNGRLDLTQAEALADVIGARSQQAVQLALSGLDGGIGKSISKLRTELLGQLAELEARIDFDEDLPPLDHAAVCAAVGSAREALRHLVADAAHGQLLREGLRVAIVGPPNVGKSSLLNLLSGTERAIVTPIPGTTRDTVESELVIKGVPITVIDTAGIRETEDLVERLGIERSRQALESADVVVQVFDLQQGWGPADDALDAAIPHQLPRLRVGNKADLTPHITPSRESHADVLMSAATGRGLAGFEARLLERCGVREGSGVRASLNRRQLALAQAAEEALGRVLATAADRLPIDFWTIDLRAAIRAGASLVPHVVAPPPNLRSVDPLSACFPEFYPLGTVPPAKTDALFV